MGTYVNAYEILSQVRYDLNEYSTAFVQATDTSGSFQNSQLMAKINQAQRMIWNMLFVNIPEIFLTSTSLSFSSSTATLPTDFYKIRRLEDSDKVKIEPITLNEKYVYTDSGSKYQYYRYGNTLQIDKSGVSGTYTIWYYTRPRNLDQGVSSAGGALSLTLATTAPKIADYFNNMTIENITDDWTDTISDYSAARVCTLAAQTGAASKYYGIVSELPEAFHHLIQPRATILCKSLPNSPTPPTRKEVFDFGEMLEGTLRGYAGTNYNDVFLEDVVNDFQPYF